MKRQGAWRELAVAGGIGRFLLVCLGVWLHAADSLATATVVPALVSEIRDTAYVAWTISLYQIGAVVAGSATARLSQRTGIGNVLAGAATIYGAGCLTAALAPTMAIVLTGRLIQGVGGGMLPSLSYVAIQQWFAAALWGRLFGIVAVIWSAGSLLGPLIGGVFVHLGAWRLTFWSFALQAGLLAGMAAIVMPSRPAGANKVEQWNFFPLLVLSAASYAIAAAGAANDRDISIVEGASGVGLLWLAAWLDKRSPHRLLPEDTLSWRRPVGLGLVTVFALAAATTGFWAHGPLILQAMFGTDPLVSGYILAGEALAWTAGTMALAGIKPEAGRVAIRAGAILVFIGAAGFALAVPLGYFAGIISCALLQGLGFGVSWPSIVHLIVQNAREHEKMLAAAAPATVQTIAYSLGAAATGIAANAVGLAEGITASSARIAGFWVFAAFIPVLSLGLLSAWRFTREEGLIVAASRRSS
ncbi:MAG TPA: MFS transporter [Stellaceae bacterium]|nr:MFS transporter [Stellaceae bacterium]